ncbi:sugar ABC transporter substrate-binding protein [Nocardiopsis algeriensis]|uniref:Arabinogalactan oligomer/maltooligosaccharide transport system substrate-binding protein n=1 Tax=Nocardiopsis algeriensis TaxID=1478215 RepID=A0A841IUY4_9ACTN|nr:maltose ABC transporter substrate-binding protein [Nocardiopsis algeriensis]MBB6121982.1 arabinogalactan oligomer/maltooligosaccharide transport system substrate-binding protein [Nocardiopsis algeriensis]
MNPFSRFPRRRPLAPIAGACAAVLLATACGGGETETDIGSQNLVIWADDERALALMTFAEAYSRTSRLQVDVISVENAELRSSFKSSLENGMGPDILVGPHDWTGELAEAGAIAPVALDPAEDGPKFVEGALDAVTRDGEVYGIPYATENLALLRNTDLAPEAPATFEEMVATGKEAVSAGSADRVLSLQVGETGDAYHLHPLFTSAGGYLFGEDAAGDPDPSDLGVAAPESVAAFERLAELGESGVLSRSVDAESAGVLFTEGAAPFYITGPWSLATVRQSGIPYEVSPVPAFADGDPARPLLGVQTFFVSSAAKDPELAARFASDLADNAELSVILYEADPRIPALEEALQVVAEQDPDVAAFQEAGEGGLPMPAIPEMEAVWSPFGQASADIIDGADPAGALAAAEAQIRNELG